jgi:hypothetical protein
MTYGKINVSDRNWNEVLNTSRYAISFPLMSQTYKPMKKEVNMTSQRHQNIYKG